MSAQPDWFAIARHVTDVRKIGVDEPRTGEETAAGSHDPAPARDPFGPSPTPNILLGLRMFGFYLVVGLVCAGFWAGIVALIWRLA